MVKFSRLVFVIFALVFLSTDMNAQVNAVTFGKNRVQYKKFKWQYYQTQNFNVYRSLIRAGPYDAEPWPTPEST